MTTLPWRNGLSTPVSGSSEDIPRKGVETLGHTGDASHVLVSYRSVRSKKWRRRDTALRALERRFGRQQPKPVLGDFGLEARTSNFAFRASLEPMIETMEAALLSQGDPFAIFVAEINTKRVERSPEITPRQNLERVSWGEYDSIRSQGPRSSAIAAGCEHDELKRHIEAWQEMKRTGSKWVTGHE